MQTRNPVYRVLAIATPLALLLSSTPVSTALVPSVSAPAPSVGDAQAVIPQRAPAIFIENVGQFDETARLRIYGGDENPVVPSFLPRGVITPVIGMQANHTITFTEHVITDDFSAARSVYAEDVDGDGDVDVLGAAFLDDDITWWENDGSENFTEHIIDFYFDGAHWVYATDVDGDGDVDVLGAAYGADEIAWWENDGNENFAEHIVADSFEYAYSVYATDIDSDGDVDIMGTAVVPNTIAWWENDGNENFTEHIVTDDFDSVYFAYATDLDGDGDADILAGNCNTASWWENDGNENFTQHVIASRLSGEMHEVYGADIDGDRDMDVLGATGADHDVVWWENDGSENFTEHIIDGDFGYSYSVHATDVDGDGDMDVLGAARDGDEIAWWENDGHEVFTKRGVTVGFDKPLSVYATDIDGDGDVDVLGAANYDDAITWWEQTAVPGTISGRITSASSGVGLSGVKVSAGSVFTTTAPDGTYSMAVPPGTYVVKASPGTAGNYYSNQLTGVRVEEGLTTIVDLKLTAISWNTVDTLIVANFQRMKDIGFDATDVDNLEAKLNELKDADPNETNMTAVIVDLSPGSAPIDITNAYAAWNNSEGNPALNNSLVREIDAYIEEAIENQYKNVEYIIIVGSSEVIPMAARPADNSIIEHLAGFSERGWVNSYDSWGYIHDLYYGDALDITGRYLTDSLYRDTKSTVLGWDEEQLSPELAVGRLVETPEQIVKVVNAYLDDSNGYIGDIQTDDIVVIASEDALDEGQEAIDHLDELDLAVTSLVTCNFNSIDARDAISSEHSIVYFGSHANYNALATNADAFWAGSRVGSGDVNEIPTLEGSVILASGCHAGVNIGNMRGTQPVSSGTGGHEFPEDFASKGAIVYIASTGYAAGSNSGCNSNKSLGYSEELLTTITRYLADGTRASIGQAYVDAMNKYASQFWVSNLDQRILAITTFYGIPNARIVSPTNTGTTFSSIFAPLSNSSIKSPPDISNENDVTTDKITLDISEYTLITDKGIVELSGAEQTAEYGKPILPNIAFEKALSGGSTITSINFLEAESNYVEIPFQVSIGDFAFSEGDSASVFTETGFYPATHYQSYSISTLGGDGARVGLNIMPIQYNQDTGTVRIWEKLVFEVEYTLEASLDSDADGLPDYWERNYDLDPHNDTGDSGAAADIDLDGLTNLQEHYYGTNPHLYDTDGDGANDGLEVAFGTNPNNYYSKVYWVYLPTVLRNH